MISDLNDTLEVRVPLLDDKLSEPKFCEEMTVPNAIQETQSHIKHYHETSENVCVHVSKDTTVDKPMALTPEHKQSKPFISCVLVENHKQEIINTLHILLDGKGGRDLVYTLRVLVDMEILERPTFSQIESEFDIVFSRSAYEKYYNGAKDMPEVHNRMISLIFSKYIYNLSMQ